VIGFPVASQLRAGGGALPALADIRVDGLFFVTAAGTYRPLYQSGLTLLARTPDERDAFLDDTVGLGFNGVRTFAGHLGYANQTPLSARVALPGLLAALERRRLGLYCCAITGGKDPAYDVEYHLTEVAAILRGRPGVLLEGGNEIGHPSLSDLASDVGWLLPTMRRVVPAGLPWTLGAPLGTDEPTPEGTYPTAGGLFNDAHLDRDRDTWNQVRRLRELAAVRESQRTPMFNGEMIGADEQMGGATGTKQRRNDPPFFFAAGLLSRGFELATVFHSEDGLWARTLRPVTRACAEAFVAGWRAIDTHSRLDFINAGWAGSPVAGAEFDHGIVRAYSFVSQNRGWTVLVGLKSDPRVVWGGGWRPVGTIADQPGIRVIEITK